VKEPQHKMCLYKFVHQKPTEVSRIQGDRTWGEIKADLESNLNQKKTHDDFTSSNRKRRNDDNLSFLLAYFQHEVDTGQYRLVNVDEMIPESATLIIQRLPKKFALSIAEVRLANRYIIVTENNDEDNITENEKKRPRPDATEEEKLDFLLNQPDVSTRTTKKTKRIEIHTTLMLPSSETLEAAGKRTSFAFRITNTSTKTSPDGIKGSDNLPQKTEVKKKRFKKPTGIPKKFLKEISEEEATALLDTELNVYAESDKFFKMK
jgi:hypothetical protein